MVTTVICLTLIFGSLIGCIVVEWFDYVCSLANPFKIKGNFGYKKSRLERYLDGLEYLKLI